MTVSSVQIWRHRVTQDTAWGAVPVRAAAAMTPTQGEGVPRPVTAWDELTTRPAATPHFLSLGDELIDGALGGGIGPGVTEIWGEEGSGKSHLGLLLALQVQLPLELGGLDGTAVYISTEGSIPVTRLKSLSEGIIERHPWMRIWSFLDNISVYNVQTFEEQQRILFSELPMRLSEDRSVRLVVIDSISGLLRTELHLHELARVHGVRIIAINQVADVVSGADSGGAILHRVKPALGLTWTVGLSARIAVTRDQRGRRQLHVLKSPCAPDASIDFTILDTCITASNNS
ncbi:unnamed protein product (mitochondrion) [Plasmodiophora brassicae]|uniref:RecA family profile 1 domain-containing protein n=1 Tax=Plasmodiophora brassicae TaxID=37360 RepID=A0A3P3YCJ3_PLABS|nr:unnamed protein product [Plasmodiophora brassicae]